MREFFGAARITGDDIDALFGNDNAEQAAQSNALPMLAEMTGDLPPNNTQVRTASNSAVHQRSINTAANPPVATSFEPQEEGNGAAAISTTPPKQQQPTGNQLRKNANAAPPTASEANQPQMSPTLAKLHATNNGPPSTSSAPPAASPSRKRVVEAQLPAGTKRTKRSGIHLDELIAL